MDLTTIDLPITLRLWHDAGLRTILSDPETVQHALSEKIAQPAVPQQRSASARPPAPAARPVPRVVPTPSVPVRTRAKSSPTPIQHPSHPAPPKTIQTAPQVNIPGESPQTISLPPEIRAYFSRIRIPAFSLWTYWDFPVDLSPSPDIPRQKLLKNMLQALHWPKGSSVFWPMSRIENGTLIQDLELFAYGAQAITPVYVFCFGTQSSSFLLPDRDTTALKRFSSPYTSAPIQILPDLADMLPDNKITKNIAWKILQSYTPMPM